MAYQEFCEHNKLYYNENFCKQRESSQEEGYQVMAEFSQLPENNRPQAIIAASTQAGKGALRYAQNNKEWQPFVVPFSDEKIDYPYYVFFPDKELGKSAFDLLEKHLKDYLANPEKKLVPFSLISSG